MNYINDFIYWFYLFTTLLEQDLQKACRSYKEHLSESDYKQFLVDHYSAQAVRYIISGDVWRYK